MDSFLLLWGVLDDTHGNSFSVVSLLLSFSSLDLSSFSLFFKLLFSDLLLLHLVDSLDEDGLVLELITLRGKVEMMVDVSVDLLGFSIFPEESSKYSLSSHPEDLRWHSCVSGSLSFTETSVSAYNDKSTELIVISKKTGEFIMFFNFSIKSTKIIAFKTKRKMIEI